LRGFLGVFGVAECASLKALSDRFRG